MTDSQKDLVLHLLHQGQWTDAITAYCEETGADEDTARSVVKDLAAEHNIHQMRWSVLAFYILIGSCALAYVLFR